MARRASGGTVTTAVLHDALGFLVRTTGQGPSCTGNRLPWRFRLRHGGLDVLLDRSRLPGSGPAALRLGMLSCGSALLDLRLAVGHLGFDPVVECLPDSADPDHLARLTLGAPRPANREEERLVAAMALRRSHPGRFEPDPVERPVLDELAAAAREEGARLVEPDPGQALLLDAVASQWLLSDDLRRPPSEGAGAAASPVTLVLTTRGDGPADLLAGGQALERLLLAGAARSTLARMNAALLEDDVLREQFRKTAGRWYPQMVLEVGRVAAASLVPSQPDGPACRSAFTV